MPVKINLVNPLFQSPYEYLQAAGSTGADGSAAGIHLRWDFQRVLGNEHLAKGNLSTTPPYNTSSGFNKVDDFINIYRISYNNEYTVTVDFLTAPDNIIDDPDKKEWDYTGFTPVPFDSSITTDVKIKFLDLAAYDTLKTTVDPTTDTANFMAQYPGVVEVSTPGKLKFKGLFKLKASAQGEEAGLKIESISAVHYKFDEPDSERFFVSSRRKMLPMGPKKDRTIICENIDRFRFQNDGAYPTRITLSTYEDHIKGENGPDSAPGNWELVGQFSLDDGNSDSNTEVFRRLEDIPNYLIDKFWAKYNENDPGTGEFTVKVQNYEDKWTDPEGLKQAVIEYLTLSTTDPLALSVIDSDEVGDDAALEISYLDMLKIVSLDFHVARMLGLGHIDKSKGREPGQQDGGDTDGLIDFINDLSNSSKDVADHLEDNAPLSDPVLIAAIDRSQPLADKDLRDVLTSTEKLSTNVLTAVTNRQTPASDKTLKTVMSDNVPLSDSVLMALINMDPPVSQNTLSDIMEDNSPLTDEVLLALINRDPQVSDAKLTDIMEKNSPLSDEVLIELINSSLSTAKLEDILLDNTPLSELVIDALLNRQPPMPQNKIDNILNSTFNAGSHKARKCIYVMEYITLVELEGVVTSPQTSTHLYMSLPTSQEDFRLPPEPFLCPVSYGLEIDNKSGTPTLLTDADGYAPYADERIVNLHREPFIFERPFEDFFADATEFDICDETIPVQYGVEYKKDTDTGFRRPELNHDPEFLDHAGIPETLGVAETGFDPMYIHQETEEGIHEYAAYSINWFSRISPDSNIVATDFTQFQKRQTLLPPTNFAVQLIQEESPLIFTTSVEQTMLDDLTSIDKTLVRATFSWNHIHRQAYQFADFVEFCFREEPPLNVQGKVGSVTTLPDNQVQVTTTSYVIASASPAITVTPDIAAGDESRYVGGLFTVNGETFLVADVISTGPNPTLILNQIRETNSLDPDNTNIFCTTETYISPDADEIFMLIENLNGDNWDSQLNRKVYLEEFHSVDEIDITGSSSPGNDQSFTVINTNLVGSNTEVEVLESIPDPAATTPGNMVYQKKVKVIAVDSGTNTFTVEGDITAELSASATIIIKASHSSDGNYTVTSVSPNGADTDVEVSSTFTDTSADFYLFFDKTVAVSSINGVDNKFILTGDLVAELTPPYRETITLADGTQQDLLRGGVIDAVTITDIEDVDGTGTPIPGSRTGVYEVEFDTFQLEDHISPDVDWYKGIFRVLEDATQLPPPVFDPSEPNLTVPETKTLDVWQIDTTGSTLKLLVYDPTFKTDPADTVPGTTPIEDYVPIQTGSGVQVNFHPSYRVYLTEDTSGGNDFSENTILPAIGDGSKQTFMAARSVDSTLTDCNSFFTAPVVLLAQEIVEPLPPGEPTGPAFATRPDFYGKSTYTFDVEVETSGGRVPYALVFYRASERTVLDRLYKPTTVAQILNDLENLVSPDADFFNDRWSGLVNADIDSSGLFKEYTAGGYRFPIPDNDAYIIPDPVLSNPPVTPFDGVTTPGDSALITLGDGSQITMLQAVQDAINGAFLPLSEQPVIYKFLESGQQTSGRKPTVRDDQDNILVPGDPGFDPFPMAVKFNDGADKVRFTDYTLDGAAQNFYFFYGVEMSNKLELSERSPIAGPILLVNSAPAEEPAIKVVTSQLATTGLNPISTEVHFEMNDYVESENIKQLEIYRTTDFVDAQSVRTMTLAKTLEVGEPVIDDFGDLVIPPFGEPLYYRIVALREIRNEQNQIELVPSKPTNIAMTNVVDNLNPEAPVVGYSSDPPTTSTPIELPNVSLNWSKTAHNGIYHVYKMSTSGNWTKIHSIESNDDLVSLDLVDTDLGSGTLVKQDEDGNTIYHRFRIDVVNSSGLPNIEQNDLVI